MGNEMKQKYQKLLEAYSEQNLTELTSKIIHLYKTGNKSVLTQITRIVSDFVKIEDGNISKIFAQLIMLVHPDKSSMILSKINEIILEEHFSSLRPYLFILELDNFEEIINKFSIEDEIILEEDEVLEDEEDEFQYFDDEDDLSFDYDEPEVFDFYHAVKKKIYGNKDVNFPPYYLEDYEEMEMSDSGITDLSGVEYCKYVKKLYLNNNEITDVSDILNLENIEELYLSKNQIGFIDSLESLENLKILDLSFNDLDDISPILELHELEFVNLLGTHVPQKQIDQLKENEIIVIF